ncbi:MAG: CheF family chemotaxis protein [Haloarculaceae archaeon]
MSDGEHKLADSQGKFVTVIEGGRKRNDVDWMGGRILLSNKRIVLASSEGKRTIPLSKVSGIKSNTNVNEAIAQVSGYISVQVGADVTLVAPQDIESFEAELYDVLLDQRPVLVKHPALKGGVVQDTNWEKGRMSVDDDRVDLAITSGTFVELEVDDVATVEETTKTIRGDKRAVVEVEHTIEGTSVQTHVTGARRDVSILGSFVRRGEHLEIDEIDLTQEETEVLMALYTGVSPFEIPDFVGMDIGQVEEIFDRLQEYGVVEEVRVRREVELQARGRSIAGEAMSEQ